MAETPTASPEKKSKKGLILGCVFGCLGFGLITAIIIGILVFRGASSVSYKSQAKKMFADSQKWSDEMKASKTVAQGKTTFESIRITSEKNLETLNKSKPPASEKKLDADLKEYYTITDKVATGYSSIFDMLAEIENISNEFKRVSAVDITSPDHLARTAREFKTSFDKSMIKIDAMQVPPELAEKHSALKTYFRNFSDGLGKMITAAETRNPSLITSSKNDLITAMNNIVSVFSVASFDDLYKKDIDRATQLESEIVDLLNK